MISFQSPPPIQYQNNCTPEPKKRAWRHGRAWKMKIRAWKIRIRASIFTSIFMRFYINIPFKLIVSDALRIAIKHACIFKNYFIVLLAVPLI